MKRGLLPYPCRYAGMALLLTGAALGVCYLFFDFTIRVPVFAVLSSFLETRIFTVMPTNIVDELILILLLSGFFLVVFAEEKKERKRWALLRYKAWNQALILNSLLLFLSILFVYGTAFVLILTINLFSTFLLYLAFFYFLKRRSAEK